MTVENGNKQESQENTIGPVPDAVSSQEAIEPDQIASGAAGTGQENEELKWMKRQERASAQQEQEAGRQEIRAGALSAEPKTPRLVERKTGLRGQAIDRGTRPSRLDRHRIEKDLLEHDSDIPYTAAEKAQRDLVCSLVERQDRMTEQLLLMINDLQYRTDDLELTRRKTGIHSSPDRERAGGPATSTTGRGQP
jgi:hypothetical protein